ncbi:hypothetical protein F4802DRAFT_72862 [Xylaria palmicola]|nr:hypothetical protein F4802DRAFT_72862 [Xylaria palmicola]
MAYAQSNMQAGEELATLFSRHMTIQQPQPAQPSYQQQQQQQQQQQAPEPEPIKYSISQHYNHSAHIVHQEEPISEPQRASSVPPQTQPSAEAVLIRYGVNPSGLSPQQLDLFKTADTPQQIRLIELWRICPPTNWQQTNPTVAWTNTTVEQEELLAQRRHEQRLAEEEEARRNSLMSMDGTPLTPIQTADGHWVPYAEEYMVSGYDMLGQGEYVESVERHLQDEMPRPKEDYRLATDPAYANDWFRRQQAMENQYGAFQQMGDMEL